MVKQNKLAVTSIELKTIVVISLIRKIKTFLSLFKTLQLCNLTGNSKSLDERKEFLNTHVSYHKIQTTLYYFIKKHNSTLKEKKKERVCRYTQQAYI